MHLSRQRDPRLRPEAKGLLRVPNCGAASALQRSVFNAMSQTQYPKLHNAMWPGLVGKGSPGAEPSIDLDTMLELTANAAVNGIRFDGVDLFLFDPHISIDISVDDLKRLPVKIRSIGFVAGL